MHVLFDVSEVSLKRLLDLVHSLGLDPARHHLTHNVEDLLFRVQTWGGTCREVKQKSLTVIVCIIPIDKHIHNLLFQKQKTNSWQTSGMFVVHPVHTAKYLSDCPCTDILVQLMSIELGACAVSLTFCHDGTDVLQTLLAEVLVYE